MHEAVTDILAARHQQTDHISRMLTMSFAAHGVLLAALFIVPRFLSHQPPPIVMTISLGGTPGPPVAGMTAASGRPVEEVTPQPRRPEPTPIATAKPSDATAEPLKPAIRPKAATTPVMAPAKPAPDPRKYYSLDTNTPTSNKPTTGTQLRTGTSQAETNVKGLGSGLASGGTGGVKLDVDFCCPDYIALAVDRIREHWQDFPVKGTNIVRFTIERDGTIKSVTIEQSSRVESLDLESKRALLETPKLPPLPVGFSDQRLTVHLTVVYGGS
jgi:TonB family protein